MAAKKSRWSRRDPEDWDAADPEPDYDAVWQPDGEPAAKKASKLEREMAEWREAGASLEPVLPAATRDLSRTFWGQAWNRNLQTYAEQSATLSKGRTEFRKGRVMDLQATAGEITAIVASSRLHRIRAKAAMLDAESWAELRRAFVGDVASVGDLLAGEIPEAVLLRLAAPETGLFPDPGDLRGICDCPDHANLCVHAAAALYAFGSALDSQPALLFTLRGGQPQDLVSNLGDLVASLTAAPEQEAARAAALEGQDLGSLFGFDAE
jgi:uncharacterized Zn finger protein